MRSILFAIITSAILCNLSTAQDASVEITLEDIFKTGKFRASATGDIKSLKNGVEYSIFEGDSLNIYSYKTGKLLKTLLTSPDLIPPGDSSPIKINRYVFSGDEMKILIAANSERIYRRSSKSDYYIYNLENYSLTALSQNGKQQLAEFSPDGNRVAFVRDNNLFIKNLDSEIEEQITHDGQHNKIIYGATDWVYEEEFGFAKGFQWSPDGTKLAFYRFDESHVKEFQMTIWGTLYPEYQSFKYPKAGEDNSIVSIHIYNLDSGTTNKLDLGEDTNIYIPRIKWTRDAGVLSVIWMNRLQNEMKIILADTDSGSTSIIYQETNDYYVEINDDLTFLSSGNNFILTSEQDGFNHIYLFDMLGNLEQQITHGSWDVDQLLGVDEKKGLVYYVSSESSPVNRELYSIKLDGSDKTRLSESHGNNAASFSEGYKYYINTYSNAGNPPRVTLHNAKGKELRTLEDNGNLKDQINACQFSPKEFFEVETEDGYNLNAWMIKPPGFDPQKKYPVLMYVYGGPGSQTVRNSWDRRNPWHQMLAQKGIIIVSVDNRGTGSRGEAFKKMTYLQLGKYETEDQIATAKHLSKLPYVDSTKIGIWGWSYGGFMAASCMTKGAEYFTMGIAVAPVTNWRYYDNIYTERFMRTPQENPLGYEENSPINFAEGLKGDLLIIHGTADDNVHLQNSMDLVSALVKAGKQFDMQFYPNSNHGIYSGVNTTYHLYELMTNYIMSKLVKKAEF